MTESREGRIVPSNSERALAQWLQGIMQETGDEQMESGPKSEARLELLMSSDYHQRFYRQLPDFSQALLNNDGQATIRYASLLYHLVGCEKCRQAYLDMYDAMRAAIHPQGVRPILGQGTKTLDATPHRMLSHLCRVLISQAETLYYQGRHEHSETEEQARALLRLALQISVHIVQSTIRREALGELVRVAGLFEDPQGSQPEGGSSYAYVPVLAGAGNMRSGMQRGVKRGPGQAQEPPVIQLKARNLDGFIVQQGKTLELHLQELDPLLRGRFVCINVALGSLIEPVRWRGGNPRSIKSVMAVDATGSLITPLGETELQLSNPEERNLLEALFLLLQVRACDQDAG